jgi:hypothetical protein
MMERQPVQSCNLKTVGYDTHLKNLEIEFHSGMVFQYQNVPSHIFANLLSAQSTGTFFTDKIKNRYRSIRLDKVTVRWLPDCIQEGSTFCSFHFEKNSPSPSFTKIKSNIGIGTQSVNLYGYFQNMEEQE